MLFGDYLPERWIWASMNDYYHVYAVIELTLISVLRSTYICMPHNDVTTRDLFASLSNSWAVTSFVFCASSFARPSLCPRLNSLDYLLLQCSIQLACYHTDHRELNTVLVSLVSSDKMADGGWSTIESDEVSFSTTQVCTHWGIQANSEQGVFTSLIENLGVKGAQFEELISLDADTIRSLRYPPQSLNCTIPCHTAAY